MTTIAVDHLPVEFLRCHRRATMSEMNVCHPSFTCFSDCSQKDPIKDVNATSLSFTFRL